MTTGATAADCRLSSSACRRRGHRRAADRGLMSVGVTTKLHGPHYVLDYGRRPDSTMFTVAPVVWAIGLIAVSVPFWWLLRRLGLRHWIVAAVTGFLLVSWGVSPSSPMAFS